MEEQAAKDRGPDMSRRDFLKRAAGIAAGAAAPALLSGCASGGAADPEIERILDSVIGVDVHTHAGGVHFRPVANVQIASQMRQGRMTALCLGHTGDGPALSRDGENRIVSRSLAAGQLWRHTQERLDFMDGTLRIQGLRRALKRGDIEQAHRDRAPAVVQMIEGCQFLDGRLERIAEVHQRGVRQLQLVHFLRSDLGDNQTESPAHGGLTPLGRDVIAECNRLGIVVDTAHATMRFVEQAAKASRTPLLLSHSHVTRQPGPQSRLLTREHARLIAATGGVLGVWSLVSTDVQTLSDFAERVARTVEMVGVDHVAISSDVGGSARTLWADYATFPEIVRSLRQKGLSATDIGKVAGGNYVRVFNASVSS
jgi:membrane dipeptidase